MNPQNNETARMHYSNGRVSEFKDRLPPTRQQDESTKAGNMKHRLAAAERQQAFESMLADLQSGEFVVFDDSRSGPTVVRFCGKQLGIIDEEEYQRKAKPFQAAPTGLFRSVAHALEAVRLECKRQKFWPNCYHVNDHGNVSLWDSVGRKITSWV